MGRRVSSWKIPRRTNLTLEDIARQVNPVLRGWLAYFTMLHPSVVIPLCRRIDRILMRWARKKYKRLKRSSRRARNWLQRVRDSTPKLFAHWALRY
jgi:RNA-directed DNA polymerase